MATARELLQQADALMRRNRQRDTAGGDGDIPVLTDVVAADAPGGITAAPVAAAHAVAAEALGVGTARAAAPPSDVPVLTEIVEDFEPISIQGEPEAGAGAEAWPDFDEGTAAGAAEAADRSRDAADAARWAALAEEVRMQVLQRIDIFTDTGLQQQLAARLQPIVDRASADLVATINQQVGQLLRAYVAEAIEREIDKWRQGSG